MKCCYIVELTEESILHLNFVIFFVEDDVAAGDVAGSAELANCSYKGDSDPFKKRMALSDFSILKVLGKGSFGKVCHFMHLHRLNSFFSWCI